jgi:MoxR-like ATPase
MDNKYILSKEKEMDVEYIHLLASGAIKSNCIPSMLLLGEPGAGKTSFGKFIADKLKAHFIFAPCYDGVGAEQLVYNWDLGTLVDAMTDEHTKGRQAMKDGYLLQALKMSHEKFVVLLIDEIDKAKPSVDTFLLTFLQECMLNDPLTGVVRGKKENMLIIFTSNQRRELEDALDRRFTLIREFKFPNRTDLIEQVNSMLTINYNETKKMYAIDLALAYRSLPGVEKKPSQNQIADLIHELYAIGNTPVGRKTSYQLKFQSMLWKFSQNADDHVRFISHLKAKTQMPEAKLKSYVGSMI